MGMTYLHILSYNPVGIFGESLCSVDAQNRAFPFGYPCFALFHAEWLRRIHTVAACAHHRIPVYFAEFGHSVALLEKTDK